MSDLIDEIIDVVIEARERGVALYERDLVIPVDWGTLAALDLPPRLTIGVVTVRLVAEDLIDLREDVPTCH